MLVILGYFVKFKVKKRNSNGEKYFEPDLEFSRFGPTFSSFLAENVWIQAFWSSKLGFVEQILARVCLKFDLSSSKKFEVCFSTIHTYIVARFLALVTTMVTKVDHGN